MKANWKNKVKLAFFTAIAITAIALVSYIIIYVSPQEVMDRLLPIGFFVGESGSAVTVDNSGNIFIYGRFSGPIDFDPGPDVYNLMQDIFYNAFLSKFNSDGEFQWVRTVEETADFSEIAADNAGNIYVVSLIQDTFGVNVQTDLEKPVIMLWKYDTDGNIIWTQEWESTYNHQECLNLRIDDSNDIVVYYNTINDEIFIRNYNSNGELIEEGILELNLTSPFVFDNSGTLYVVGCLNYDIYPYLLIGDDIKDRISLPSDAENFYIAMAEFNSDFNNIWTDVWGDSEIVVAYGICLDPEGNVLITGSFLGSVDFDPGSGVHLLRSAGFYDAFLAKFDGNGNFLWAESWGHWLHDWGSGVCADTDGSIFVTGSFSGKVDFNPGWGLDLHESTGRNDIFLCKYDSDGNFLWALTWGGENMPS